MFLSKIKEDSSSASEKLLHTMPSVKSQLKHLQQENKREITISKILLSDSIYTFVGIFCSSDLPQATLAVEFTSLALRKGALQYLITNYKKPRGRA